MIWEFHETEKEHGRNATAYDIDLNGYSRNFVFVNNPEGQRKCNCRECNIAIPRAVPRIKFKAQFNYHAGYYCMKDGIEMLQKKKYYYQEIVNTLMKEMTKIENLIGFCEKVMDNPFYAEKMAMSRMCQVISE